MQIILGANEELSSVGIHFVNIGEFIDLKNNNHLELVDLNKTWMIKLKIGKVDISLYTDKRKCVFCGKEFQEVPESEYCESCYDRQETKASEERELAKLEAYQDDKRG